MQISIEVTFHCTALLGQNLMRARAGDYARPNRSFLLC